MKTVIRAIQTQPPPIVLSLFKKKKKLGANFLDANPI
jgi:hypothetical protein